MPKLKDFINPVKVVVTAINPVAGAVLQIIDTALVKPTKKVNIMLEGKKTYIGIAVTAVAFISQFFGYEVGAEDQSALNEAFVAVAGAFGLLLATYGRVKATKK